MDFDLTDDQRMLSDTAGKFARNTSPVARFRKLREDPRGWEAETWRAMGELGWLSIPFPESVGGFGGGMVDAMLVLEKLGTTLVPEPYLSSVVLAGRAVQYAGTEAQQKVILGPMMEGRTSLALASTERDSRYDPARITTRAERDGAGYRLRGEKIWVENGHAADVLIVSALAGDGVTLFAIPRDAAGLSIRPTRTIHEHRTAVVTLDGVLVGDDSRLGPEGAGRVALDRALDCAAAGAVAEGLGISAACLEMTTGYLRTREQFGVKIGTFQALQHRAVDMFVEVELLRSMAILAAIECENTGDAARRAGVSAAKVQLSVGGKYVVQQAIQLHGGIGITDEHDVGLYFKRMTALMALYGDEEHHLGRFAAQPAFVEGVAG